jgi:hypothetical protein
MRSYVFGRWAATPWWSGTLCSLSTPSPPSLHDYHGNSRWQAMGPDPYYPELLPTKHRPIPMPHNTLSSWLHPGYKNWAAISPAWLLRPCSLGTVNLTRERALNKACLKPACFIIWLQFGLPISVDLTLWKLCVCVCVCETGVWTQDFKLAKQVPHRLSRTSSPFWSRYFGDRIWQTVCPGLPWTRVC